MNNTETQEALAQDTGRRQTTLGTRHRAQTNNTGRRQITLGTRHRAQTNKTKSTTQKTKMMDPPKSEPSYW